MKYILHYDSPLGCMNMASNGEALTGLWFEGQKNTDNKLDSNIVGKNLPVFELTGKWLDIYFSGGIPNFTPPLSFESTDFREAVWNILLTIPYGRTMTYEEIAERIALQRGFKRIAPQAVGGAVAHNPIALIIPCHRVIGKDGNLTGYAAGLDKKEALLKLEKAI